MSKRHKTSRRAQIVLREEAERVTRQGHPWVFHDAVASTRGHMPLATLIDVHAHDDELLGQALYSTHSKIRARMLSRSLPVSNETARSLDEGYFLKALGRAARRRALLSCCAFDGLRLVPSRRAYRLVNSEGDGLPGVLIDVLGELLVVQITTAPMHRLSAPLFAAIASLCPEHAVLEIPAPSAILELERFEGERAWRSSRQPERLVIEEGDGVRFEILTEEFQKTGHYADMLPHRLWVAARCGNKRVLDAYCYTGGFGLHAARAGAAHVTAVDSSSRASARAEANAAINGVTSRFEVLTSKVERYLEEAAANGARFDVTVLDPPKLAPSRRVAHRALKHYISLCEAGLNVTSPGGLMCLTSCSEAIGERDLSKALALAASRLGRDVAICYVGAQASDHPWPAAMHQGHYATFIAALVD